VTDSFTRNLSLHFAPRSCYYEMLQSSNGAEAGAGPCWPGAERAPALTAMPAGANQAPQILLQVDGCRRQRRAMLGAPAVSAPSPRVPSCRLGRPHPRRRAAEPCPHLHGRPSRWAVPVRPAAGPARARGRKQNLQTG